MRFDEEEKLKKRDLIGVFVFSSSDTNLGDERELSKAAAGDNVCNVNSETPRAEGFPFKKWL